MSHYHSINHSTMSVFASNDLWWTHNEHREMDESI